MPSLIRVVVDDLAFVEADAVLRPADAALQALTPAMRRLDEQGGARFAALRRVGMPLDAGAAVVTGGGDLTAPFVLHLVLQDPSTPSSRDTIRRALTSAWQQAAEWQLASVAAPPIGAGPGQLALEEAVALLAETFPRGADLLPSTLTIVVEREHERESAEAALRILG
jgi:O-acetyl-ADP-ribose deacetylase (regulator of RNase III)